jgi:hypothetical protein
MAEIINLGHQEALVDKYIRKGLQICVERLYKNNTGV